ncbi:hypothetical protein [Lacipirellula parvula]|uniref:Uncharacterized protein n=1 Tax=Lacipirellula parvula TaxID=2650471 RepID=A0A5K7XGQ6_9BACT|nr:hypothetical protein [Lacipirellula parvula]BBO34111.1 hypothetical protein PLANPX_3723 [Lacipirellula parvula]
MKLSVCSITANRTFVKALRRQSQAIADLQKRFEEMRVDPCPHEILLLAFVDRDESWLQIVSGDQEVFLVHVGYDFRSRYPVEDDVLVIQLLEEKITQMIDVCGASAESRKRLRDLVEQWTTEMVVP